MDISSINKSEIDRILRREKVERGKHSIMKKSMTAGLVAVFLFSMVLPASAWAQVKQIDTAATVGVRYQTHIQDIGWENTWKTDGALSGTVGQSKRLEALKVELTGSVPSDANIETYVHVQDRGDMGPFSMGEKAGTEGYGLRMERITLVLNNMPGYTLKYDVQVENLGWLKDENDDSTWYVSGQPAGTTGRSLRLESIKIKLVKVNAEYEAYKAALGAVDELDYTVDSWADYEMIVDDNLVTEENSADEISGATAAIKAAQKMLVKGKNMTAYKTALAAVKEVEYTPESWETYQQIVDENVVTQADTQIDINTATSNIVKAQKDLQRKLNLTDYNEALAGVREADYTVDSWAVYQTVLATNVISENNTQTQVDAATKKILAAQKQMVRKFDFTAYNALLNAVKEDDYTTISWAIYQKVVNANVVTENDTQTDVQNAILLIEAAQKKLVKASDLSGYEAVLDAVEKDSCTTTSWAAYLKVVEANVVTKNNTQAEIDAATDKIMKAQLKLVGLGDMTDYNDAINAVSESEYTSKSWETYKKVVDANKVTPASGQTAIDAATTKIISAQSKLIKCGILTEYNRIIGLEKDNEILYTSKSWAIYMKVVYANEMDRDKSQSQINTAILKIQSAQQKLVEKGDTAKYLATLALVKEDDFTVASWTTYKKILTANYMTSDNSQSEINAAIIKIENAQLSLVKKGGISAYEAAIAAYEGKEDQYKTAAWAAYQKVLNANIMTTENTQAQIEAAVAKILNAQSNLASGKAANLTYYKQELAEYDGKQSEYTADSWATYQGIISQNLVTKDDEQTKVNTATVNINNAQKNLKRATDLTAFKASLDLYQENLKNNGYTKPLATLTTWSAYATKVETYASFDANGDWVATTGKIIESTDQIAVAAATEAINAARSNLTPSDSKLLASFVLYDAARTLPAGTVITDYTIGSYALYKNECDAYVFPIRIKASADAVTAAATSINSAKTDLEKRATVDETKAFIAEAAIYNTLFKDNYTAASWKTYYDAYVLYVDDPITCLDTTKNTAADYETGRKALDDARIALVPTAQYVSQVITKAVMETAGVHVGTDLVAVAQSLISTPYPGYTIELATPNSGVDAAGKVSAGATTVAVSFKITQTTNSANTYTVSLTGLTVTAAP